MKGRDIIKYKLDKMGKDENKRRTLEQFVIDDILGALTDSLNKPALQ